MPARLAGMAREIMREFRALAGNARQAPGHRERAAKAFADQAPAAIPRP
jgi:hypothetical protein